jgi:hypothetical protein
VWRHAVGQEPFPGQPHLNLMFSKWQLAPLRLLDLFALMVIVIHWAEPLARRLPRLRALETLGAASLPVFCAHLVLVLLALALLGAADPSRALALDAALLAASLAALYGVARVTLMLDRQAGRLAARRRAPAPASATVGANDA